MFMLLGVCCRPFHLIIDVLFQPLEHQNVNVVFMTQPAWSVDYTQCPVKVDFIMLRQNKAVFMLS